MPNARISSRGMRVGADVEMDQRTSRLRTVIAVVGHLNLAHAVRFDPVICIRHYRRLRFHNLPARFDQVLDSASSGFLYKDTANRFASQPQRDKGVSR